MTPKQFLQIGGIVLVVVAILGFTGVLGPTPDKSIFGPGWWFDNGENWAHVVIGIVALAAAYILGAEAQRPLVITVGVIGVAVGLYSIFQPTLLGANLENPADTILHLLIGIWALVSVRNKAGAI